jgi:hypothetical protein
LKADNLFELFAHEYEVGHADTELGHYKAEVREVLHSRREDLLAKFRVGGLSDSEFVFAMDFKKHCVDVDYSHND